MVSKKGNKTSKTSNRPVLKSNKTHKKEGLTADEKLLEKKVLKEGLTKKGKIPRGNIALEKSKVATFQKNNTSVKKKLGKPTEVHRSGSPGIVCLTNLPHGFFEKQLRKYFTQFGDVNHTRVVRSKLTGRSCGYAYVEFKDEVVARIAAETMDNYLTYGKIIKCKFIEYSKHTSDKLFGEEPFRHTNCPKVISRGKAIRNLNALRSDKQMKSRGKRMKNNFGKKLKQLQALGVNLDLEMDIENSEPVVVKDTVVSSQEGDSSSLDKSTEKENKSDLSSIDNVQDNEKIKEDSEIVDKVKKSKTSPLDNSANVKTSKVKKTPKKQLAVSEKKKRKVPQDDESRKAQKQKRLSL